MPTLTLDAGFGSVVEVEYSQWNWTTDFLFFLLATAVIICPIVLCAETFAWACKSDKKGALFRDPPFEQEDNELHRLK